MPDNKKRNTVEEQRARQWELIELKRKREEFIDNPDEFKTEEVGNEFVQSKRSKLSNFWYYSRFTIVFILLLAIILAIGVSQCATRTEYDMTIVMYFKTEASSLMSDNLAIIAEQYCKDYNKDGKVEVLVVNCSIPDGTRLLDTPATTRLLGQFQNEEAIVYIVDTGAYEDLRDSFGDDFLYSSPEMPDLDNTAFKLNGSIFDAAFNTAGDAYSDYTDEFDYYLLRRKISEKSTANKGDVADHVKRANRFIADVMNDPGLWNVENDHETPADSASGTQSTTSSESEASKKQDSSSEPESDSTASE